MSPSWSSWLHDALQIPLHSTNQGYYDLHRNYQYAQMDIHFQIEGTRFITLGGQHVSRP